MSFDTTASRFLRPTDVARLRRNQRRVQAQRFVVVLRGAALIATIVAVAVWAYRHTQSDRRFAVQKIEVDGAAHTAARDLDVVTTRYVGLNLFKIDIDRVQRDLGGLAWVRRIDIEKQLPGTLKIRITEREPVALLRTGERLSYVDDEGLPFAELSPAVGSNDLPVISAAAGTELRRTVQLLGHLRSGDREIYSRISEVWPIAPRGFAIYDRELGAVVYANGDDISEKYRKLHAVIAAENHPQIEYADLRFAGRVIVKPLERTHAQN